MKFSDINSDILKGEVLQKKADALCARILHQKRLSKLKKISRRMDIFTVCVPAAYFPLRLAAKGTSYYALTEFIWLPFAVALAFLGVYKIVVKWQDAIEVHSRLVGENITLATQAESMLRREVIGEEEARHFLALSDMLEKSDRSALGEVPEEERKKVYLQALREVRPQSAGVVCPICKSSPWQYTSGSCQACGNEPKRS